LSNVNAFSKKIIAVKSVKFAAMLYNISCQTKRSQKLEFVKYLRSYKLDHLVMCDKNEFFYG